MWRRPFPQRTWSRCQLWSPFGKEGVVNNCIPRKGFDRQTQLQDTDTDKERKGGVAFFWTCQILRIHFRAPAVPFRITRNLRMHSQLHECSHKMQKLAHRKLWFLLHGLWIVVKTGLCRHSRFWGFFGNKKPVHMKPKIEERLHELGFCLRACTPQQ